MGWVYLVGQRLDEMNAERDRQERRPLNWGDVGRLTGINAALLRNLENNSELRATNTRFLDSLCRLFACGTDDILRMVPERPGPADHDLVDDLLGNPDREPHPNYHVDILYGDEAQDWWKEHRDEFRPRPTRR